MGQRTKAVHEDFFSKASIHLQLFQITDKLFRLIDHENLGSVTSQQIMEFLANVANTRPRAGFDKGSLEWLEQLFRQTVGNEKEIRREDFQKIVISKNVNNEVPAFRGW